MAIPVIRVFNDSDGNTRIYKGSGLLFNAPASALSDDYTRINDLYRSNNRLNIKRFGQFLLTDLFIDQIADEQGTIISPNVVWEEVHAYFISLGFNQTGGNLTNYYTKQYIDANFVPLTEYNSFKTFVLEQLGYEQLDTPTLTAGTPTQTSIPLSIGAVANATSYKLFRDGVEVYSGAAGLQTITGLTAGTSYTFTAQAFADGYAPSDAAEVVVSTLPAQQAQLATPSPVASNITSSSITISWPAVPNATIYEVRRNNIPQTGVQGTTFVDSGLNPSTQYQYIVIAKAQGYIDSPQGIVSATTQSGQQPGNTNIFPLKFPFQFAS